MKTTLKRLFSLLMVLVMVGSMLPAVYADSTPAEEPADDPVVLTDADYAIVNDVFAQIDAMEDAPAKKSASRTQITDAAAEIVMASENYVEGSLERNGNSFTWWTDEGIRCIYNPYMREKYDNMQAPADPEPAGIYNEPKATKGGWPSGNQVYLIAPYYGIDDTFTDQYKNEAKAIASAIGDTDGYTLYSGSSVTVDNVADAIENGAVVIFDSHGTTDYDGSYVGTDPDGYEVYDYVSKANYSYLCLTNKTGLTTADYNAGATYFTDSDGVMCACINGAAIANHMDTNSPAGILWMAICLGMATDTMCEPMREKGVEVVYGYSQSVTFAGDYCFEETFWDNMIAGKDVATSIAAMKSKWGNWDWSEEIAASYGYSGSGYTLSEARQYRSAFPIVVSDEDTHPGQRGSGTNYGACSEQTVKSTYTLFSQYNVTAQSNNTSYGTVSASGSTITAAPATGYFAESATVVSGTATVTQNGNTFSVAAESDCTVQINFAPKTAVTVNFSGANVSGQTGYAGDSMTLPTAEAPEGYTFLGWTTAPLSSETTEKPSYYTDSFVPTANTTLYALYSYVDENSGSGSGNYVKVTESRDDWSGEYVIVYEADGYIFDGSLDSFDAVSNYQAVTITDGTIAADEADAYKFTIAAVDDGYSIQGASGGYIGQASNTNGLTTGSSALVNTISLDASGNANIIGEGGAYLRYNATDNQWRFRYYKSSSYSNQKAIALYIKDGSAGVTYYVSTLCEHPSTSPVDAVEATCTEVGYTAGTQCDDCGSYVTGHEVVAALGHSWSDWTVTTAPGCETAGEQTRTCSVCGETEKQSVSATGHSVGEGAVTTAATCTTDGVMTYTCTACGNTTTEAIPATGHSYTDGVCAACGEAEPEVTTIGYYIAAIRSSGNYFYMTSDLGTASTKRYQAVDSGLTVLPEVITEPQDGYVFILVDNGDGTYSLQAEGVEGDNYLGWTSGNSGTLVAQDSALKLTVDITDGIYNIHFAASDAERYLALNGTTNNNYFAWYKSGQKQDLVLIPVEGAASEPEATEPEVTEPEATEPETTEPEVSEPAGSVKTLQYVFSDYTAGTQYAEGENHTLDDVVTLTINGAHLNSQIRLYAGSNAVFTSTKVIDSIIVKAGYKAGTLNVYGSTDGVTWTLIKAQATTTTYTEYSFDMPAAYNYVKLESVGAQIRVSEMTINVLESGTTEPEVTEPEVTEPEVTEPEETAPPVVADGIYLIHTADGIAVTAMAEDYTYAYLPKTEITVTNGIVSGHTDANIFTLTYTESGYTIQDIYGRYLHMTGTYNSFNVATELPSEGAYWSVAANDDGSYSIVNLTMSKTIGYSSEHGSFGAYADTSSYDCALVLTPVVECEHSNTTTTTVAATCTTAGSTTVVCSDCGATVSEEAIPALGHSYVDGVCTNCGEAEPESNSARYYIAAIRSSGNYWYMTSDLGTGTSRYQAVDSGLTVLPESITAPEAGYVFVLIDNGDGTYSLQAEGVEGDNYLGWTSGNSGTLVAQDSALKLTVDITDGIYNIHFAASDAERYLALNGTTNNNYFAWYKSGQKQDLYLLPVAEAAEAADQVNKWGLVLGGDLSVKFNVTMQASSQIIIVVAEQTYTYNAADLTANADGSYDIYISLAAAQMNDAITVKFVNGETESEIKSYTVLEYANTIKNGEYSDAAKALVQAMLNYGGAAQTYFGYKKDNLVSNQFGSSAVPTDVAAITVVDNHDTINFYGASLVYREKIAVRFYFAGAAEDTVFQYGDKKYTAIAKDGMCYVEITDILPQNLDQQITLTLGNTLSVTYGPMNYIVRMYEKGSESLQNLMQALYNYHLAAKAFVEA